MVRQSPPESNIKWQPERKLSSIHEPFASMLLSLLFSSLDLGRYGVRGKDRNGFGGTRWNGFVCCPPYILLLSLQLSVHRYDTARFTPSSIWGGRWSDRNRRTGPEPRPAAGVRPHQRPYSLLWSLLEPHGYETHGRSIPRVCTFVFGGPGICGSRGFSDFGFDRDLTWLPRHEDHLCDFVGLKSRKYITGRPSDWIPPNGPKGSRDCDDHSWYVTENIMLRMCPIVVSTKTNLLR